MNESKIKGHIAVIGLGYVGLPLVLELTKKYKTIGFDIDKTRIKELKSGVDRTNEVHEDNLNILKRLNLTSELEHIDSANIYIITVPTPVDKSNKPDLNPIVKATEQIGSILKKEDIVIYESTVFPGCTEEVCVPILERQSGLVYNQDFFCGYSPERINPGDKAHTLTNIKKVVSGSNQDVLKQVSMLYNSIINAGTYEVKSIKIAEAAKVIENTQRDVNIALINELALIFNKLGINTREVLDAASSKWNFLPFEPGLVGGHCIGVDPYYLTYKAMEVGYHPEVILAGRKINDGMGEYIVQNMISELANKGINPSGANIGILGFTFKENCPDIRNTQVFSIVENLKKYNCNIFVSDPYVDVNEVKHKYNLELYDLKTLKGLDALALAVSHDEYKNFRKADWEKMLNPNGVVMDVKSIYNSNNFSELNITYWSL